MRLSCLVLAAVLMTAVTAAAQWKEYPMPQLGFIVEFPSAPAASTGNYKTQMLVPSAPVHVYSVREPNELYMALVTDLADAGEESLQHVALNLPGRVADDFSLLAGEPLGALLADVLVVGDAQNVSASEGERGLVARRPGGRRTADGRVIGRHGLDAETPCGADSYQRRNSCE